jgi:hypothetical protein
MSFFYNYRRKLIYKSYQKAVRLQIYMAGWSKWYFLLKFNRRNTYVLPKLQAWSYRSLYTNKQHYNNKTSSKKVILMHLFWVLDVWKLAQPLTLKGISTNFPISFECHFFNNLVVYSSLQNWLGLALNKDKLSSFLVTKKWLNYKPDLWMSRYYQYFVGWRLKDKKQRQFLRNNPTLWFINKWYIENSYYHKIQARFLCQVPTAFPINFTKTLWLRLMRYPTIYNYKWFPMLKQLSLYPYKMPLPWSLLYTSKQTWMFDYKARGLSLILKALVLQRTQITEYVLVKRWRDLLIAQDSLSRSFQIFIRTSIFFRQYLMTKAR